MSRTQQPVLTLTAKNGSGSTIPAHRFITAGSALCGALGKAIGVSEYAAADGKEMAVIAMGVAVVETGGAFSAGARIASDSTGRAIGATAFSVAVPSGGTDVTSDAAQPNLVEAGGFLPQAINGTALETSGGAGEFVRVLLSAG